MILSMRIAPALAILMLAGATWLPAQKPVNVDGKVLRDTGSTNDPLPGSWLSYGRNQSETRYSTLKQINDTNAKRLGPGLDLRGGRGRRQSGRYAAGVEQHALRHHHLERSLRARRQNRQGAVALGSGSEPDRRAPQDLLRHRESRRRDLQRHDHRARDRRTAGLARRAYRQAALGSARGLSAGLVHAHHGAAHRRRQGHHRRIGRRQMDARLLRRVRRQRPGTRPGSSTPFPEIPNCRPKTMR